MRCPKTQRKSGPSKCLTCKYFGGFHNSGVLCYKAKRRLPFEYKRTVPAVGLYSRQKAV